MAISFPSSIQTSIDVPEPKRFDARFVYNFFMPDEKLNDEGLPGAFNESADLYAGKRRPIDTRVPRFIEVSFDPVTIRKNETASNEFLDESLRPDDIRDLLIENFSNIQSEIDVAAANSTVVYLQDSDLIDRYDGLLRLIAQVNNVARGSAAQQAKALRSITAGGRFSGGMMLKVLGTTASRKKGLNSRFKTSRIVSAWRKRRHRARKNMAPDIPLLTHFNSKFVGNISNAASNNPFGPYSQNFAEFNTELMKVQKSVSSDTDAGVINADDLETTMVPFEIVALDDDELFSSSARVIGYVIDKQEIMADGSIENREPLILSSAHIGSAIDSRVKYGAVYTYSIRAIALVQMPAVDQDDNPVIIKSLISSRASRLDKVKCIERIPPPPPADIDFIWDYTQKKMMVMWNFPTNPQRDIKRFQVLRRSSVDDPFELLVEYDFDDSEIPTPRSETPRGDRVIPMEEPVNFFIDHEFTRDSSFIYALCCIDARDLSSNYSMQFNVSFDRYKNSIVKDLISPSGAPKPYPNFYLKGTLTEDVMKDSGHFRLSVFFDPEYLTVMDDNDNDFELLATDLNGGSYKLQVLNIDRQKNKVLTFNVKDLR